MKYLGFAMLVLPFVVLYIACGMDVGFKVASMIFVGVFGAGCWLSLAVYFLLQGS